MGDPQVDSAAPARTDRQRENQLIALAIDLAEKQLRDGTAPASVINHYLKLGSTRERLEQEKIERENRLLESKKAHIDATVDQEQLMAEAIAAMKSYQGSDAYDSDI